MASIELRDVTRRFGETTAVDRVSLTIAEGEFFILVGPSGCGKSTLLNMIVGLDEPTEGDILVDGRRVNGIDARERNMAMVFQSYAIYPHMTVRENMSFPLRLAKLDAAEREERVRKAAEVLDLADVLDRKPAQLSGGQRQRVAMGRAIVREPAAFLLDEPLSNLDAKLRVGMRTEIARLQRRLATTTVYVTHDQTEAMTLGDRIALLADGRIQQIGTPRELYEQPANLFTAGFIGLPPMNFLSGRAAGGRLETPIGVMRLPEAARTDESRAMVAGFRPEDLSLGGDDPGDALCFEAEVEVVEWLGADVFVYFEAPIGDFDSIALPDEGDRRGGERRRRSLVARLDPGAGVAEGDRVRFRLDPNRVRVFDAPSGRRLR